MVNSVTVKELVKTLQINIAYGEEFAERKIMTSEVSRPGLVLSGYTKQFPFERIQLFGKTEMYYLQTKSLAERKAVF